MKSTKYINKYIRQKRLPFDAIMNDLSESLGKRIINYEVQDALERPLSVVFKIRLNFDLKYSKNIYVKAYHQKNNIDLKKLITKEYETTQFWYDRIKDNNHFQVIKPLYYDTDRHVIITEESKGHSLEAYLKSHGQFFPTLYAQKKMMAMLVKAGEWLRYFQSVAPRADDERLSIQYLMDYVNLRLDGLVANPKIKFDKKCKEGIGKTIMDMWQYVEDQDKRLYFVHSDLTLSNILIHGDKVTVLDFPRLKTGSLFKDVTRFYHQLSLMMYKPTFQKRFIHKLMEKFMEGYGNVHLSEHPLFKIYMLIHQITHLGKNARFWEHSAIENIYNRWVVYNTLRDIKKANINAT